MVDEPDKSSEPIQAATNPSDSGWGDLNTLTRVFRIAVVASIVSFVISFFEIPWKGSFVSAATLDALSWIGHGALLQLPDLFYWLKLLLWIAVARGIFTFKASARTAYLILCAFELLSTPLLGLSVYTAFGDFFGDIIAIADGVVLTLAYLSPLRTHFR